MLKLHNDKLIMKLNNKHCYEYPRPALTTDCIIFGFDGVGLKVLLIERGIEPFKGKWALPGGFVRGNESTVECAKRELYEETGIKNIFIEQSHTFSEIGRDPRGHVVSVSYYALVKTSDYNVIGGDDAVRAKWFNIDLVPSLAFDHEQILQKAFDNIKFKIRHNPIGFELLDEKFTMPDLQLLYELILEVKFDRRNFNTKMLKTGLIIVLDEKKPNVPHRAPRLLKFDKEKYKQLLLSGFNFDI